MRADRPIEPRLLIGAAIVALVAALVSLALQQLVLSAMSWLVFELFVVVSAVFITTPQGTRVQPASTAGSVAAIGRAAPSRRVRIYPASMHGSGQSRDESSAPDDHAA